MSVIYKYLLKKVRNVYKVVLYIFLNVTLHMSYIFVLYSLIIFKEVKFQIRGGSPIDFSRIKAKSVVGSFHVNSTRPLNPPSGILMKLGVYIILTLVRNYAKYFFPGPHSFVKRRDQNFEISPHLTIF